MKFFKKTGLLLVACLSIAINIQAQKTGATTLTIQPPDDDPSVVTIYGPSTAYTGTTEMYDAFTTANLYSGNWSVSPSANATITSSSMTSATVSFTQTGSVTLTYSGEDTNGNYLNASKTINVLLGGGGSDPSDGTSDPNTGVNGSALNYIKETIPLIPISDVNTLNTADNTEKRSTYQYFDGLGRGIQTVQQAASPLGKDIVSFIEYDEYGRAYKKYLPYTNSTGTTGDYVETAVADQASFYSSATDVVHDNSPFSITVFEESPLSRIEKQGAAGDTWQPSTTGTDHTIRNEYISERGHQVYGIEISDGILTNIGSLHHDMFKVKKVIDENGAERLTYLNNRGQVILKRKQVEDAISTATGQGFADTYYVYDDFNRLAAVVSPEGSKLLGSQFTSADNVIKEDVTLVGSEYPNDERLYYYADVEVTFGNGFTASPGFELKEYTLGEAFLEKWVYLYEYDSFGRMIKKRVPGADWVYMVYDNRDRLVLTQDGNQRTRNEWLFTKYDYLNRTIITGVYSPPSNFSLSEIQYYIDNFYYGSEHGEAAYYETRTNERGIEASYTNRSFPILNANTELLTMNFYDDYNFVFENEDSRYRNELTENEFPHTKKVTGQLTGGYKAVLNPSGDIGEMLPYVNHYDDRGRLIQTIEWPLDEGYTITSFAYDFSGNLIKSKEQHAVESLEITERFTYDHAGRLLKQYHHLNIDGASEVLLSDNSYNELGQLIEENLGDGAQRVNYAYNIRGWLKTINGGSNSFDHASDKFGMELSYDDAANGFQQYNGNIGQMNWKSLGNSGIDTEQTYHYSYDQLSRLKSAAYNLGEVTTEDDYGVDNLTYDWNGNIQNLSRNMNGTEVDDLSYSYNGNQLIQVEDASGELAGFDDLSNSEGTIEYTYDANGNMISDENKSIAKIEYNLLNLPSEITFNNGNKVEYYYDATGRKLAKHYIAQMPSYESYLGSIKVKDNELAHVQHAKGRYVPIPSSGGGGAPQTGASTTSSSGYQFNITDHLGNVRVTINEGGNVVQRDDYLPFGLTYNHTDNGNPNLYKYNGKEEQEETDWYDYGARMYDAALGRWHVVDAMAEEVYSRTPYRYAFNNPVNFIDPDGNLESGIAGYYEYVNPSIGFGEFGNITVSGYLEQSQSGNEDESQSSETDGETEGNDDSGDSEQSDLERLGGGVKGALCPQCNNSSKRSDEVSSTDVILATIGSLAYFRQGMAQEILADRSGIGSGTLKSNPHRRYNKVTNGRINIATKLIGWSLVVYNVYNTENLYSSGKINESRRQFNHMNTTVGVFLPHLALPIAAGDYIGQRYSRQITNSVTKPGGFLYESTKSVLDFLGIPTSPISPD